MGDLSRLPCPETNEFRRRVYEERLGISGNPMASARVDPLDMPAVWVDGKTCPGSWLIGQMMHLPARE